MFILLTPARFPDFLGDKCPQLAVDLCRLIVNVLLQSCRWQVARQLVLHQHYLHPFLTVQRQLPHLGSPILVFVPVPEVLGIYGCVVLPVVAGSWGMIRLHVWVSVRAIVVLIQVDDQVCFRCSIVHVYVYKMTDLKDSAICSFSLFVSFVIFLSSLLVLVEEFVP